MQVLQRIYLFIKNYIKQFKRKFLLLPLILFVPLILIGIIISSLIFIINPDENDPIKIGLVDYDQSAETEAVIQMIEDSSQFGSFIQMESMSENKAENKIISDQLSAYIVFPSEFTSDLYVGNPVSIDIIGNDSRSTESYLAKELLDSIIRHIRTSQASILMVNEQAKQLGVNATEREAIIFDLFTQSFLNILGKDNVLTEKKITNYATAKTVEYYAISIIFILSMVWLITIYNVLYNEEPRRLQNRMKLYGVTEYEQIIARFIVTLFMTMIFTVLCSFILNLVIAYDLVGENIVRISFLVLLNSVIFLQLLAFCEVIIPSHRFRLLTQLGLTLLLIVLSGAIVPAIYLPLFLQKFIVYLPSYHSFYWLQELLLNERFYADFKLLIIYVICGFIILGSISLIKERVHN